eukprot:2963333-Pleurochrysis_carterae.AAC.2
MHGDYPRFDLNAQGGPRADISIELQYMVVTMFALHHTSNSCINAVIVNADRQPEPFAGFHIIDRPAFAVKETTVLEVGQNIAN